MGPKTTLTTGKKYDLTLNKIQEHTYTFLILKQLHIRLTWVL